jgi:hypothetical protein
MANMTYVNRCPLAVAATGGLGSYPAPGNNRFATVDPAQVFNAAEVTAWNVLIVAANAAAVTAGYGQNDPGYGQGMITNYGTYLASVLAAAKTAGYTPGTAAVGSITPNGIWTWLYNATALNGTILAPGT